MKPVSTPAPLVDMPHDRLPLLVGNPLLAAHAGCEDPDQQERLIREYSFAIPTDEALAAVAACSASGVVEIGSGTGYWARMLHERGVDVIAYDIAPPPSAQNRWFAGAAPWFPVRAGDHRVVAAHANRTLLLVWPTSNETWPSDTLQLFADNGGRRVAFVGEAPGGSTGDDLFHALLGAFDRCWSCAYDLVARPCICGVRPQWAEVSAHDLPGWGTRTDQLRMFERAIGSEELSRAPRRALKRSLLHPRRRHG